jgi:hypothetical protein
MRFSQEIALLGLTLAAASLCTAGPVTYDVAQAIGPGRVSGFLETDGTTGILSSVNIVDWNLLLNDGISTTFDLLGPLSGSNSQLAYIGSGLSATPNQLLFDFGGGGYAIFQHPYFGSGIDLICYEGSDPNQGCAGGPEDISGEILNVNFPNRFRSQSGVQVIGTAAAPEPSTLILLGAGIALIGFRKLISSPASKTPPALLR